MDEFNDVQQEQHFDFGEKKLMPYSFLQKRNRFFGYLFFGNTRYNTIYPKMPAKAVPESTPNLA